MDGVTMAVLGIGALAALKGYLWVQDGEIWKAALLGVGTALGLAAGAWAWWRWKKARNRVEDPILIQEKVSRIAFDAEIQVTAVLPDDTGQQRAGELLGPVAAAYRHFDNPAGARFKVSRVSPPSPILRCCTRQAQGCSARAASWESARLPPCGTRPEQATRRPWWRGPAQEGSSPRPGESGEGLSWETPPRASPCPSTSPKTCSGGTTCTSPAPAWASPPSCTT